MSEKDKLKFIVEHSECERCKNKYPKFQVVEKETIKDQGYYPNCDCVVEIKLKKWQIPILLGAAGLGDITEGQCSRLTEASEEGLDRYEENVPVINNSFRWRKHVGNIIDQIKNQTGLNLEYMESANKDGILDTIFKFVEKEVHRRIDKHCGGPFVNRDWVDRDYPKEDEV